MPHSACESMTIDARFSNEEKRTKIPYHPRACVSGAHRSELEAHRRYTRYIKFRRTGEAIYGKADLPSFRWTSPICCRL